MYSIEIRNNVYQVHVQVQVEVEVEVEVVMSRAA